MIKVIFFLRYQIAITNIGQVDLTTLIFFYTKKVLKNLPNAGYEFINFSFSAYSFKQDHKNQKESQINYYRGKKSIFSANNLKRYFKRIIPDTLITFRQDFLKAKRMRSEDRMNWFVNNTGDNCYIRGILRKK